MVFSTKIRSVIFFIIVTVISCYSATAYSAESMDVVLVMDSSGSMKKTDPDSLRIPAAKLFISLLGKDDRAGVMSFSERASLLKGLTAVNNDKNRAELLNATENITSDGLYTNLFDAMDKGRELLLSTGRPDSSKVLVLMSDGMMDVGDAARDKELITDISGDLTKRLKDEGIKVYTIAFTEQSDRRLLEKVSKRTDGFYNLALTDSDLHVIFTSIFESLKAPEMLPMEKNGFLIDRSVEEVTIVATKADPKTNIQLEAPDGQSYTYRSKNSGVKWFQSNKFDMITVKLPVEGRWEILFSTGRNNKAYVITDLRLRTNFDHMYTIFGRPMDISFWLEKENEPIKEKNVIDKIDFFIELTGPGGKIEKIKPFDKGEGVFVRKIAPFTAGNYKMKIAAEGKTFEREKTFVFNVAGLEDAKEDVQEEREDKAEELEKEEAVPVPQAEEPEDEVAWGKVIGQFLGVNIVLFSFAYIYYKRKDLGWLVKIRNIVNPGKVKGLIMFWKKDKEESGESASAEMLKEEETDVKTPAETVVAEEKQVVAAETAVEESVEEQPVDAGNADEVKEAAAADETIEEETATDSVTEEGPEAKVEAEEGAVEEDPAVTTEEAGSTEEVKAETAEESPVEAVESSEDAKTEAAVEDAGAPEEIKEEATEEKAAGEVMGQDELDKLLEGAGSAEDVKAEAAEESPEDAKTEAAAEDAGAPEEIKEEATEEKAAGEVMGQDELDKLLEEAGIGEEVKTEAAVEDAGTPEEIKEEATEEKAAGEVVGQDDLDKLFEEAGAAPAAAGDVEKPDIKEESKVEGGNLEASSGGLVTQDDLDKLLEEGK